MSRNGSNPPDALKEKARAMLEAGFSLGKTARQLGIPKSTLSGWKREFEKDTSFTEARQDHKQRFIAAGWEAVMELIRAIKDRAKEGSGKVDALATALGIIYDKVALASGEPTQRSESKDERVNRHEYDVTHRVEQYADIYRKLAGRGGTAGCNAGDDPGEPLDPARPDGETS